MPGVTKEQISAAKRMSAIEFLRRYRGNDLVKSNAHGEFELRSHNSFKINGESSIWHWKSRDIGGRTALDYLIHVEQYGFVDAVLALCGEVPQYLPAAHEQLEKNRLPFSLPPAAPNMERAERYLLGRGISQAVIRSCAAQGILFESLPYHNCVFVGLDETGSPRYAGLRGTFDSKEPFRMEVSGSEKQFGFCIRPAVSSTKVAVFEAAIDAMAEMTLHSDEDKYRLSLGGIYAPKNDAPHMGTRPIALEEFLRRHPEVNQMELCLDNDHAGHYASRQIQTLYQKRCQITDRPPQIKGGDYADLAKQQRAHRAVHHRAALCR